MTEQEAQGKACPWNVAPKCITRGCMAWLPMYEAAPGQTYALPRMRPVNGFPDRTEYYSVTVPDGGDKMGYCARIREAAKP